MLTLPSPAKINLFLHITGRRDDGYHTLQTLFQLLDYGDDIGLDARADGNIKLTDAPPALAGADNLIIRAALALQAATGCSAGADITLNKRLPVGGGVGGGSSNAATTLLGLNHLWGTGLPLSALASIGAGLGADVPVFVQGQTAWAEGTGEQLRAVETGPGWYLVLRPAVEVATAEIFSAPQLTRNRSPIKMADFFTGGTVNDCQNLVCQRYPDVDKALNWLDNFSPTRLTGTGACVFAKFNDERVARSVLSQTPAGMSGFVAAAVQCSPLHRVLGIKPGS